MKSIGYIGAAFALFLSSCGTTDMEKLRWLNGTWKQNYNGNQQVVEWDWSEKNITGRSYLVSNGDTTEGETMQIQPKDGKLNYTSMISENELTFNFPMTKIDEEEVIFEKPDSDYFQKIVMKNSGDSLVLTVKAQNKTATMKYSKVF